MRFLIIISSFWVILSYSEALAQTPSFEFITITGTTDTKFNRVSLFENGSSISPLKTDYVSEYSGEYSINIEIPTDMSEKDKYFFTDMRFWNDKNDNNIKDSGEYASECHFIMWVPSANKIYMQVYQGERYPIESSVHYYNYQSK